LRRCWRDEYPNNQQGEAFGCEAVNYLGPRPHLEEHEVGNLVSVTSASRRALSLTLVRHGESDWNVSRLVQGQDDQAQLTEAGRAQAQLLVAGLRAHDFHHVVSSDLARARETAAIFADALTLTSSTDPLLRERCFGTLEGGPWADLTSDLTGVANGVVIDPDARPVGGESFRDVVRRAELFVEKASAEGSDGTLLVVTHGGMIRAIRAFCSRTPLERLTWDLVGNASVWTVRTTELR
jgi:probable phosphoglycerate mutase